SQGFAAGYEKSIMWGGRTASQAGISTSYIMGADALYFNPAGLVAAAPGSQVSLNVSPVWSSFEGPYNNQNETVESKTGLSTPLGLIYSNSINDKLAFGVGGFISGGSRVEYDAISFPGLDGSPQTKTDLQIGEISAGVAYKITDTLKIGAAYRYVMAKADFSFFNRAYSPGGAGLPPAGTFLGVANAKLTDLKDEASAFRLGAQWAMSENTHFGFTYRSSVDLDAKGRIGGQFIRNTTSGIPANSAIADAEATASTTFPQAVTIGADHKFNDAWKGLVEVAWTQYSKVEAIPVTTSTTTLGGAVAINNPQLTQDWKDQWNARLGGEYAGFSWPIRFGYGFTSQVTNSDWARPTFTPPGVSHTLTAGSGQAFALWGQALEFNGAAEYTFVSGDGTGRAAGDNTPAAGERPNIRAGEHKTSSVAAHLGLAYNF
ncbi:MAG: hypothetical protein EOP14_06905, partial [Pseudomonas sp.]